MPWVEIPLGSVVRSRRIDSLDPGEWRSLTNCRLKRGDTIQMHNDFGRTLLERACST